MRLPDFLIIGAMKAGTTTLYRDLASNPHIFFPADKEPGNLCNDRTLTSEGKAEYAALFRKASPAQLCGEASTDYAKLPDVPCVPQRALAITGPNTRIIYMIRDPVSRIISQHRHERIAGTCELPLREALQAESRFIDYSRYAMQIKPWIAAFGERQVFVQVMEQYIADRHACHERICAFLGIPPRPELLQDKVFNAADGKPVLRGPIKYLAESMIYRRLIRPLFGPASRQYLRERLLPRARVKADTLTDAQREYLNAELTDDWELIRYLQVLEVNNPDDSQTRT